MNIVDVQVGETFVEDPAEILEFLTEKELSKLSKYPKLRKYTLIKTENCSAHRDRIHVHLQPSKTWCIPAVAQVTLL